jgi:hypothetical protein
MTRVYSVFHAGARRYFARIVDARRRAQQLASVLHHGNIVEVRIHHARTYVTRRELVDWLHGKGPRSKYGHQLPRPYVDRGVTLHTYPGELWMPLDTRSPARQWLSLLRNEGLYHE